MVNQRFVDRFFPNVDAIGRSVTLLDSDKAPQRVTIVGIAPSLLTDLSQAEPVVYLPYLADARPSISLIARADNVEAVARLLRSEVRALDSDLPLFDVRTLDEVLSWLLWANRVFGGMFAMFAGIAVLIATVGIYSVVSYATAQRTQEIGIRMALGAPAGWLWWVMMRTKIAQVAIGLGLGLAAAFVLLGLMGGLLVGRFGQDPLTLAASGGFLLVISVGSMLWPIWRATSRSPVVALRYE